MYLAQPAKFTPPIEQKHSMEVANNYSDLLTQQNVSVVLANLSARLTAPRTAPKIKLQGVSKNV